MPSSPSGRLLAINEWLFSDLLRENGIAKQSEAGEFLVILSERPDRILFPTSTQWAEKAYCLSKAANADMVCRAAGKLLFGQILFDSAKAVAIVPENATALAPDQESLIPEEDRYLVRAALAAHADVLVTTDLALLDGVNQSNFGFRAIYRDEFLKEYLQKTTGGPQEKKALGG